MTVGDLKELMEQAKARNIPLEWITQYILEHIPASHAFQKFRESMNGSDSTESPRLRPSTVETYQRTLEQFEAYCSDVEPKMNITQIPEFAEQYLKRAAEEKQVRTIHGYASVLRGLLAFLSKTYGLPKTFLRTEGYEHVPQPAVLSKDQIKLLFSVARKQTYGHRYVFMMKFFLYSSVWRNEFLAIQLKDIDFNKNVLYIAEGKGGSARRVPMPAFFLEEAQFYFNMMNITEPEHYIFGRHREPWKPMTPSNLDGTFNVISRKVKRLDPTVGNITPRLLRNTSREHRIYDINVDERWRPDFNAIRNLIDAAK